MIIGGSLGGLTTALALAARGRQVTVVERTSGRTQRGVAILVSGIEVTHTPRVDAIPDDVYAEMIRTAETRWQEPWRTGVVEAFRARDVVATPITEYLPRRVVNGRIGVLGDAAHAQTPMTGAGFEEAVADAVALAEALDGADGELGLERYESMRLAGMRSRVCAGQSFSRSLVTA
ncbi:FAD-dependent monooxygenase [Nocardia asteroides]|uniref:FAD-dependent monooxygenase n=1 Tax=Nocardia asteroides TaxID=1824 RepID=UPI0037CA5073